MVDVENGTLGHVDSEALICAAGHTDVDDADYSSRGALAIIC